MAVQGYEDIPIQERRLLLDRLNTRRSGLWHKTAVASALLLADVIAFQIALFLGYQTRMLLTVWIPVEIDAAHYLSLALGVLVFPIGYYLFGLYGIYGLGPIERFRRRIHATTLMFALLIAWDYLTRQGDWSRGILLFAFAFGLVLPLILDSLAREVLHRIGLWGLPAVLIGAGNGGRQVARNLASNPELGLRPVAFFDDDPAKIGKTFEGIPVLGRIRASGKLARHADVAVIAMPSQSAEKLSELASGLRFPKVVLVPELVGIQTLWVQARDLGNLIGLELKQNLLIRRNRLVKRLIDYAIALPAVLLTGPVMLISALWIMAVSPGSPFYSQVRAGYGGKEIRVLKLRTMYKDADARLHHHLAEDPAAREEWERFFKLRNDPRILPGIGHFLRRSSLDELPQLINVLKGEMSLVGPRPFPRYHLDRFHDKFQSLRSSVLPGITGLWQVSARSDGDLDVQESLDTYYIRNWSPWLDLYLIYRTFSAVISGSGAR